MTSLLRVLPARWQTHRTVMLLIRLGIIAGTLGLAYYGGRRPSMTFAAIPLLLVGGWLLVINTHWGLPMIVLSALVVPFAIGTGTGTSLNAPFLIIPALAGIWLVKSLLAGSIKFTPTQANWALGGLVITAALSMLNGYLPWNVFASLAPVRAQVGALGVFVVSALAFWVGANLIKEARWLKITVFTFIGLGGLYVLSLLLPPLGLLYRYFVVGMNGSLFWLWLAALAAGQALYNHELKPLVRLGLAALAVLTLANRLLPLNRSWASGWLPCLIGMVVVVGLRWPRLAAIGTVAAIVVGAIYLPAIRDSLVVGNEYSLLTRNAASSIILEIVRASPLFGVGPANYYFYTPLYAILGWYVRFNSHNQYIDIIAQTGLLGLGFILWFALIMARSGVRLLRQQSRGFEGGFAAACLGGLAGTLAAGLLGDWFLPFVYNIGIAGFRSSFLVWLFLGGLAAVEHLKNAAERPASPA